MFLCKWWARKHISLHRDDKVVLYCMSHFALLSSLQKFASSNHTVVQRESVAKLQKHLETIVSSLPVDLQSVIKTWHHAQGCRLHVPLRPGLFRHMARISETSRMPRFPSALTAYCIVLARWRCGTLDVSDNQRNGHFWWSCAVARWCCGTLDVSGNWRNGHFWLFCGQDDAVEH